MESKKYDIIIVDDHLMFCESLKLIIETGLKNKVIGIFSNGVELLKFLEHTKCDFILMDIEMNEMGGIEATQKVTKKYPEIHIIAISFHDDKCSMIEMLQAGAKGYLKKSVSVNLLFEAISVILNGQLYFPNEIRDSINEKINLSGEEKKILNFASNGLKNVEISILLKQGKRTIERKISEMIRRFGAKNIKNLIKIAMNKKWIKNSNFIF
jgi:DNA-binding NarL/FixJ family response regulator